MGRKAAVLGTPGSQLRIGRGGVLNQFFRSWRMPLEALCLPFLDANSRFPSLGPPRAAIFSSLES